MINISICFDFARGASGKYILLYAKYIFLKQNFFYNLPHTCLSLRYKPLSSFASKRHSPQPKGKARILERNIVYSVNKSLLKAIFSIFIFDAKWLSRTLHTFLDIPRRDAVPYDFASIIYMLLSSIVS